MLDDRSSAMDNADQGSAKPYLWQSDFEEVTALVSAVGKVVLALLTVVILLRMYVYTMRALGVFRFSPKKVAAAAAAGAGDDIGIDIGNGDKDKANDRKEKEREAIVKSLIAFCRLVVLRWSVGGFMWLAQKAVSGATGDELPLPGYVFMAAAFTARFAFELFPTLGPKLVLNTCCLVLQCHLALLRAIVMRIQRMLCSASCAVSSTFRNMFFSPRRTIWNAGTAMWIKLSTAGAIVCTLLWVAGKILWAIIRTAFFTAGRGVDAAGLLKAKIAARWEAAGRNDLYEEEPTPVPVPPSPSPVPTPAPTQLEEDPPVGGDQHSGTKVSDDTEKTDDQDSETKVLDSAEKTDDQDSGTKISDDTNRTGDQDSGTKISDDANKTDAQDSGTKVPGNDGKTDPEKSEGPKGPNRSRNPAPIVPVDPTRNQSGNPAPIVSVHPTGNQSGNPAPIVPVHPTGNQSGNPAPIVPVNPTRNQSGNSAPNVPVGPTRDQSGNPAPIVPVESTRNLSRRARKKARRKQGGRKKTLDFAEYQTKIHKFYYFRPANETARVTERIVKAAKTRALSGTAQTTAQASNRRSNWSMEEGWRKFPRPDFDKSAWARWLRPGTNGEFKRPNSKRWRKLQRLVSENSASASSLNFFPNDRPRTRPAPRHYPTSVLEGDAKRGVKRGVADVPWYKWTSILEPECAEELVAKSLRDRDWTTNDYYPNTRDRSPKDGRPMDNDQAVRDMETKFANRPFVPQGSEVHCCTIERKDVKELWLQVQYVDDCDSQDTEPDMLTYLPVTLLRPSFNENSTVEGRKWYVQPGGRGEREKWLQEGARVMWEVSDDVLFDKIPAACGETCDTCHREGQPCNWAPDELERFCDHCADAPRRGLNEGRHARDFGFKWVTTCDCDHATYR